MSEIKIRFINIFDHNVMVFCNGLYNTAICMCYKNWQI